MNAIQYIAFRDELEKLAVPSTYAQDFVGGIDPFGVRTSEYGAEAQKARLTKRQHAKKRAVSTLGGVIGGGLVVPSVIQGVMGMAGKRGLSGFTKLFRQISQGKEARRVLREIIRSGAITTKQEKVLGRFAKTTDIPIKDLLSIGEKSPIKHPIAEHLARRRFKKLSIKEREEVLGRARDLIGKKMRAGGAQLGFGAGIGAAGAYVQYGKGRKTYKKYAGDRLVAKGEV